MEKCFAESGTHCSILWKRKCDGCSFYKSKHQFLLDQLESLDKIKLMPPENFNSIANTYYSGKFNQQYNTLLKAIAENEQENAGQA